MEGWSKFILLALVGSAAAADVGFDASVAGANEAQLGPASLSGSFGGSKSFHAGIDTPPEVADPPIFINFGTPTPVPTTLKPTAAVRVHPPPTAAARVLPPPPPPMHRLPPPPPTPCAHGHPHYRSLENSTEADILKNSTNNATVHDHHSGSLEHPLTSDASLKNAAEQGAILLLQYRSAAVDNATNAAVTPEHSTTNETAQIIPFSSISAGNTTNGASKSNYASEVHGVKFRSLQNPIDSGTGARNSTQNETSHELHSSPANNATDLPKNSTQDASTVKEQEKERPVNPKFKGVYDKLRAIF